MREILRSNNPILLTFFEVLLRDTGLQLVVADLNMSVLGARLAFCRSDPSAGRGCMRAHRVLEGWAWRLV
jgi:hypothetical protein